MSKFEYDSPGGGSSIPLSTDIHYIYVGTGVGTAAWTNTLGILIIDNITIDAATIVSDTGAISFDDENLSTSGKVTGSNIPSPTVDDQVLISTAADVAAWSTASNDQVLASNGSGEVAWENQPFGYGIPSPAGASELLKATGAGSAAWTTSITGLTYLSVDNITIDGANIVSDTGTIQHGNDHVVTSGKVTGSNIPSPASSDLVLLSTGADTAAWSANDDIFPLTTGKKEDLRVPINSVKTAPGKEPVWTAYKGGQVLAFSDEAVEGNEKAVNFVLQLPHGWKEGSDISPHVHWVGEDDTAGNVRWKLTYSWANLEAAFPGESTDTVDAANAATDVHHKSYWTDISGTGKTFSSMLICTVSRNSSHANDTFTGKNAYLLEIDFHVIVDGLGTTP